MSHASVRQKSNYVYFSTIVFRTAMARRFLAALLLLSDRCAQLLRVAVADVTILLLVHFDSI